MHLQFTIFYFDSILGYVQKTYNYSDLSILWFAVLKMVPLCLMQRFLTLSMFELEHMRCDMTPEKKVQQVQIGTLWARSWMGFMNQRVLGPFRVESRGSCLQEHAAGSNMPFSKGVFCQETALMCEKKDHYPYKTLNLTWCCNFNPTAETFKVDAINLGNWMLVCNLVLTRQEEGQ